MGTALSGVTGIPGVGTALSGVTGIPGVGTALSGVTGLSKNIPGVKSVFGSNNKKTSCAEKSATVAGYYPSTYDRSTIMNKAQLYVDDKLQRIMCKNSENIAPILASVLNNSIADYLKNAPPGSELFDQLKDIYISCIKQYCDQIPYSIRYQMVQKYMLDNPQDFLNAIPVSLDFDEFKNTNDPFANVPFQFELPTGESPPSPPPPVKIDNSKITNVPPMLDTEFDIKKYNGDMFQPIAPLKMIIGTTGYSSKGAYPKVIYEALREIFIDAASDTSNLKDMFEIVDENVNRFARVISGQIEKHDLSKIICMYFLSEDNVVSTVMKESFGVMRWVVSKHTTLTDINKLTGFFMYHSIQHRLNKSLKQSDLLQLFDDYADKFNIQWDKNKWFRSNQHPLLSVLRAKRGEPYLESLMQLAAKPYVPYGIVTYLTGKRGGKPTRKQKQKQKRHKRITRKRKHTYK